MVLQATGLQPTGRYVCVLACLVLRIVAARLAAGSPLALVLIHIFVLIFPSILVIRLEMHAGQCGVEILHKIGISDEAAGCQP